MAETTKKEWERLERVFYKTMQTFCKSEFENEMEFTFPCDAVNAFVFDDSHTIFKLNNGKYFIETDEQEFTTLEAAKKYLWVEFIKWETV